jgi:hypothetical protein
MATNLTTECIEGYNSQGNAVPYLFSSPAWLGFCAGRAITGMSGVRSAHMSRGYSVAIVTTAGARVTVKFSGEGLNTAVVTREG